MRTLNKVSLIGNLGAAPTEIRHLEGGVTVCRITIATTESFVDKSGTTHHSTEWHTVILWRGLAELAAKYLKKGSLVYVEGKLKNRQYEDKEGTIKYVTEIIAEQLIMLDPKSKQTITVPPMP